MNIQVTESLPTKSEVVSRPFAPGIHGTIHPEKTVLALSSNSLDPWWHPVGTELITYLSSVIADLIPQGQLN